MLTLQELEQKLGMLQHQLQQSSADYAKMEQELKQKLANHNAIEGAVMLANQLLQEAKVKAEHTEVPTEASVEEAVPAE